MIQEKLKSHTNLPLDLAITSNKPKKIAIYIRVSTEKQADNTSKDAQLKSIFSLIKNNNWSDVPYTIYNDTKSASHTPKLISTNTSDTIFDSINPSIFAREELRRLLYDASFKSFDKLLVFSHDRLSRDAYESLLIKHTLNKLNIEILYSRPGEQINSNNNSMNIFLENLLSNLAALESNIIGGRTFMGNRGNILKNIWAGGPAPYGYTLTAIKSTRKQSRLTVNPSEARVVMKIFHLYSLGYSPKNICDFIKKEYKLNNDRLWTINSIKSILCNPVYTGVIHWNKKGGARNPRRRDSTNHTCSKYDSNLQIIDNSTWNNVQNLKSLQNNAPKLLSTQFLLKDLIICNICGNTLKPKNTGNCSGSIYYCKHDDSYKSPSNSIKSNIIHNLVFKELGTLFLTLSKDSDNINTLYENYISKIINNKEFLKPEKRFLETDLQSVLENLEKSKLKSKDLSINPLFSSENKDDYDKYLYLLTAIEEFITYLTFKKKYITERLEYVNSTLSATIISKDSFQKHLIDKLSSLESLLNIDDISLKNRCLRLLFINIIDSIKLSEDLSIEINFK